MAVNGNGVLEMEEEEDLDLTKIVKMAFQEQWILDLLIQKISEQTEEWKRKFIEKLEDLVGIKADSNKEKEKTERERLLAALRKLDELANDPTSIEKNIAAIENEDEKRRIHDEYVKLNAKVDKTFKPNSLNKEYKELRSDILLEVLRSAMNRIETTLQKPDQIRGLWTKFSGKIRDIKGKVEKKIKDKKTLSDPSYDKFQEDIAKLKNDINVLAANRQGITNKKEVQEFNIFEEAAA